MHAVNQAILAEQIATRSLTTSAVDDMNSHMDTCQQGLEKANMTAPAVGGISSSSSNAGGEGETFRLYNFDARMMHKKKQKEESASGLEKTGATTGAEDQLATAKGK